MAEISTSTDVTDLSDYISGGGNQFVVEDTESEEQQEEIGDGEPLREQDRFLPIANVHRIMKKSIPKTGKIAKDAKECVQECVSEFISFITSEASERCHQEKRKTINGEDILFAMSALGFDNYVEPLKVYLQKYRETLHQASKAEKALTESALEELTGDDAFATSLNTTSLLGDQQQNVMYTTAYPSQISSQTITFG